MSIVSRLVWRTDNGAIPSGRWDYLVTRAAEPQSTLHHQDLWHTHENLWSSTSTIQLNRTILAWTTEISHCPLQECHKSQQTSPIWEERQNSGNDVTHFPTMRSTYGHFDLRIVVINTITIWLHWPLFIGIPQKPRPILPPVTLKKGLSIQTSGSIVCWVKNRWHIMPLSRWCIFSNHSHPVHNKDVKSGPFIFHVTQHRGTVWPKVAVAQSKVKFIPELDINPSCENCSNQLHPRRSPEWQKVSYASYFVRRPTPKILLKNSGRSKKCGRISLCESCRGQFWEWIRLQSAMSRSPNPAIVNQKFVCICRFSKLALKLNSNQNTINLHTLFIQPSVGPGILPVADSHCANCRHFPECDSNGNSKSKFGNLFWVSVACYGTHTNFISNPETQNILLKGNNDAARWINDKITLCLWDPISHSPHGSLTTESSWKHAVAVSPRSTKAK